MGNYNLVTVTTNQDNKEITINDADAVIEGAATETLTKSLTGVTSPYTLTTTNPGAEAYNSFLIDFTGVLTGNFVAKCPITKRPYWIRNSTTGGYKITFQTPSGTGIDTFPGDKKLVYCDGTNVVTLLDTGDSAQLATTNNTQATLATITVDASTTTLIEAKVTARRTGGSAGAPDDGAGYVITAAIRNTGGTAAIIGSVNADFTAEDQAGWDATIDVTGATARIRVTGATNNNIDWSATWKVQKTV